MSPEAAASSLLYLALGHFRVHLWTNNKKINLYNKKNLDLKEDYILYFSIQNTFQELDRSGGGVTTR